MQQETRIGLVAVGFTWNFQRALQALLHRFVKPGQSLVELALVRRHDHDFERERLLTLLEGEVRPAAVISLAFRPDPASVKTFRDAGVPIIVIDEEAAGASTVACDGLKGGYLAGQRLLQLDRRSPALVCGDSKRHYNAVHRRRGFEKALAERGITLPPENVFEVEEYSRKEGIDALNRFLRGPRKPDGLFCAAGDATATGILAAARDHGVRIPDQLAVVSFDDMPLAAISDPPITTFRQPMEEIAREALRLATEETAAILAKPQTVLLAPTLVVRRSG